MNHQKLNCYLRLVRLVKNLQTAMPQWPAGTATLKDQLRRAAISATLNLVEGNGRRTSNDRRRFFVTACASLCEMDAAIDLLQAFEVCDAATTQSWQNELRQIYAMIRSLR